MTPAFRLYFAIIDSPGQFHLWGSSMKKFVVLAAAFVALLSAAGCTTVGKAPIGKAPAPVVTKG